MVEGDRMVTLTVGRPGTPPHVNLLKMCVGIDKVEQLVESQARRLAAFRLAGDPEEFKHMTRSVPRRADEIVAGGSLYWVIKGFVRIRQRIIRIDLLDPPINMKRCALILGPELVRTELQARRPHQGWRYLDIKDAPADLNPMPKLSGDFPTELAAELRALGLL